MIVRSQNPETGVAVPLFVGLAAASTTVLNWMGAFCVTPACKAQKKAAKDAKKAAELNLEASKAMVVAAGIQQETAAARTQAFLVVGAGALALGALYLTR